MNINIFFFALIAVAFLFTFGLSAPVSDFAPDFYARRGINSATPFVSTPTAAIDVETKHSSITNETRMNLDRRAKLGTCIDMCPSVESNGACIRNICTPYGQCTLVPWQLDNLESISFTGSTNCEIWTSQRCNGDSFWSLFAVDNLSAYGWGGWKAHSFAC
jgi:hypothetical protein